MMRSLLLTKFANIFLAFSALLSANFCLWIWYNNEEVDAHMFVGLAFDFADAVFADGNPILDEVVGMQNSFAVTSSFHSHNMTFTNRMTFFFSICNVCYAIVLSFTDFAAVVFNQAESPQGNEHVLIAWFKQGHNQCGQHWLLDMELQGRRHRRMGAVVLYLSAHNIR